VTGCNKTHPQPLAHIERAARFDLHESFHMARSFGVAAIVQHSRLDESRGKGRRIDQGRFDSQGFGSAEERGHRANVIFMRMRDEPMTGAMFLEQDLKVGVQSLDAVVVGIGEDDARVDGHFASVKREKQAVHAHFGRAADRQVTKTHSSTAARPTTR